MPFVAVAAMLLALPGCDQEEAPSAAITPPASPATQPAPALATLPVEMTVKQRSTTAVPGSEDHLLLTIDDITRNQVMVSLATDDGAQPLAVRSMSPDDAARFEFCDQAYTLTLKTLDNALVGDDFGTFTISTAPEPDAAADLTEQEKIERLIQVVAALEGATFIRNGTEHTAAEAADHLRMKWEARKEDIATADEFVEGLASRSSLSGKPYQIRLADGRVVTSGDWLRRRLEELEEPAGSVRR